jgi:hypothetical protein
VLPLRGRLEYWFESGEILHVNARVVVAPTKSVTLNVKLKTPSSMARPARYVIPGVRLAPIVSPGPWMLTPAGSVPESSVHV